MSRIINKQKLIPQFLMALLVILSLFVFNTSYANASSFTGEVTTAKLNVRAAPSVAGTIIGQVVKGDKYTILSETNGFGKITFKTKTGYISSTYYKKVTTTNVTNSTSSATFKGYANTATLNVRSAADTYSALLGTIKQNVVYDFKEYNSNWYSFTFNGKTGYVFKTYITKGEPVKIDASSNGLNKATTTAALNVRKTASFSATSLATIPKGTEVNYKNYDKTWDYVEYNGVKGYVYNIYLKPSTTSNTVTETAKPTVTTPVILGVYTTTNNLNVRATGNATGTLLGTLSKGSEVNVYEKLSNGWYKVNYKNSTGYVSSTYLKEVTTAPVETTKPTTPAETTKPTTPAETTKPAEVILGSYITTSNLNVRSVSNATGTLLGTLSKGAEVNVYEKLSNGWVKIKFNGKDGFVNSSYLKENTSKPVSTTPSYEIYVVNTSSLNVRVKADVESERLGAVTRNQEVKVSEKLTNGWFEIDFNGKIGFVNGYYLIKKTTNNENNITTTNTDGLKGKIIALDAGHGGSDPGALGKTFNEKTFNLSMVLKTKEKLEKAGAIVYLTRSSDIYVGLASRAYAANERNADIFVSFHANSNANVTASGIETFYYNSGNTRGSNSYTLASNIQTKLISATSAKNRGVKTGSYTVISLTKMPSVLLELGFISNTDEHIKMGSSSYQSTLTDAIYSGIYKYFE